MQIRLRRDYSRWTLLELWQWCIWFRLELSKVEMRRVLVWERRDHLLHVWVSLVPWVPLHLQMMRNV